MINGITTTQIDYTQAEQELIELARKKESGGWNENETDLIRKFHKKVSSAQLAKVLCRSKSAILRKINNLKKEGLIE